MKHLGELIKNHIEGYNIKKKQVADAVGITPAYLSQLFNQPTMDCSLFERICNIIGMNPIAAFDNQHHDTQAQADIKATTVIGPASVIIGENKALHELIAEKERTIQILMQMIGMKNGTKTGQNE